MKKVKKLGIILIAVAVFCTLMIALPPSQAAAKEKTFKWTGQVGYGRANGLFKCGEVFTYMIEKYTDGRVKIDLHAAGEIVPGKQVFEAARTGTIDFGQACPCVARSKAYAAQWFCDVPGGQSPMEEIVWYYKGGGKEILEDLFHKYYNAHPLMMTAISSEIWLYSNKKLHTLDDLKGTKLRAAGMRGETLTSMGASVVVLSGGEVVPAIERNVIDAMEFASLNLTFPLGFCDVTKYLYMHPVKSTSPSNLWAVNLETWNKLPDDLKATIQKAAKDSHLRSLTWGVMEDFICLKKAIEEKGSEILFLPKEIAIAVDKAGAELYHKKAKKNKDIARILESWETFKKDYGKYAQWIDHFNHTGKTLALSAE